MQLDLFWLSLLCQNLTSLKSDFSLKKKKSSLTTPKIGLQHYDSDHIPHSTQSCHVAALYSGLLRLLMSENDSGKCQRDVTMSMPGNTWHKNKNTPLDNQPTKWAPKMQLLLWWNVKIERTRTTMFTHAKIQLPGAFLHPPPPAADPSQDVLVMSLRLVLKLASRQFMKKVCIMRRATAA